MYLLSKLSSQKYINSTATLQTCLLVCICMCEHLTVAGGEKKPQKGHRLLRINVHICSFCLGCQIKHTAVSSVVIQYICTLEHT